MSEPNTSDPLHSSCTRAVSSTVGSARSRGLPKMYTVWPPMGGRNTSRSERVTNSGYMPPVSSNRTRRNSVSLQPNRLATPGRYHTGSTAAFVTSAAPLGSNVSLSGTKRPFAIASAISGRMT
ncbi:Uncharacterised protein [Mycobacteroides abscessus subsp. abscessus]|nr:Uncharacterised protein [Mycobacteroides abscessus subsp. abscessus]